MGALLMVVVAVLIGDSMLQAKTISRDLAVGDLSLGGLSRAEAVDQLTVWSTTYESTEVVLDDGLRVVATDAGTIGLAVDPHATVDKAMSMSRIGPIMHPRSWWGSVSGQKTQVPLQAAIGSNERLSSLLIGAEQPTNHTSLAVVDGWVVAVQAVDLEATGAAIKASATSPGVVQTEVVYRADGPQAEEAVSMATNINTMTLNPVQARVGENTIELESQSIRTWIDFDGLTWSLNQSQFDQGLRSAFGEALATTEPPAPRFEVRDGQIVSVAAIEPLCCAVDSAKRLTQALLDGASEVDLAVDLSEPSAAVAAAFGVAEPIGSARIDVSCCDDQFRNAQKAADQIQGHVLSAGETMSLNDLLGEPSLARGYVEASTGGSDSQDSTVGEGVSLLATALFRASFYAGLDIQEHHPQPYWQDHLVDKDGRRGLEAAFTYVEQDLEISNPTNYPILVWASHDQTSIEVALYSTQEIEVLDVSQSEQRDRACVEVVTRRVREFVDQTQQIDEVTARYFPAGATSCEPEPELEPEPEPTTAGEEEFLAAAPSSSVAGTGGTLVRYSVEVEASTNLDPTQVADIVAAILADERGWTAAGRYRFQRVASAEADIRVLVATPATTDQLCRPLLTAGWLSCRNEGKVIMNLNRWNSAIKHWTAPLAEYRAYLVNHELGHFLGFGHESCGSEGQLAPVMMQQTKSFEPCLPNGWPNP